LTSYGNLVLLTALKLYIFCVTNDVTRVKFSVLRIRNKYANRVLVSKIEHSDIIRLQPYSERPLCVSTVKSMFCFSRHWINIFCTALKNHVEQSAAWIMITTNQTYLTECFQTGNEDVFCSQPPGVKETLYTILASEQNNQTYQLSYQLRMIGTALKSRRNGTTVAAKRQIKSSDCFLQCRKASFASGCIYGISVCLSVTQVLCQNEGMQRDAVFTTG